MGAAKFSPSKRTRALSVIAALSTVALLGAYQAPIAGADPGASDGCAQTHRETLAADAALLSDDLSARALAVYDRSRRGAFESGVALQHLIEAFVARPRLLGAVARRFRARPVLADALVAVRCGNVTLTEGRMGRVGDRVAIRVAKQLRKPKTTFAMFEKADEQTKMMEAQ